MKMKPDRPKNDVNSVTPNKINCNSKEDNNSSKSEINAIEELNAFSSEFQSKINQFFDSNNSFLYEDDLEDASSLETYLSNVPSPEIKSMNGTFSDETRAVEDEKSSSVDSHKIYSSHKTYYAAEISNSNETVDKNVVVKKTKISKENQHNTRLSNSRNKNVIKNSNTNFLSNNNEYQCGSINKCTLDPFQMQSFYKPEKNTINISEFNSPSGSHVIGTEVKANKTINVKKESMLEKNKKRLEKSPTVLRYVSSDDAIQNNHMEEEKPVSEISSDNAISKENVFSVDKTNELNSTSEVSCHKTKCGKQGRTLRVSITDFLRNQQDLKNSLRHTLHGNKIIASSPINDCTNVDNENTHSEAIEKKRIAPEKIKRKPSKKCKITSCPGEKNVNESAVPKVIKNQGKIYSKGTMISQKNEIQRSCKKKPVVPSKDILSKSRITETTTVPVNEFENCSMEEECITVNKGYKQKNKSVIEHVLHKSNTSDFKTSEMISNLNMTGSLKEGTNASLKSKSKSNILQLLQKVNQPSKSKTSFKSTFIDKLMEECELKLKSPIELDSGDSSLSPNRQKLKNVSTKKFKGSHSSEEDNINKSDLKISSPVKEKISLDKGIAKTRLSRRASKSPSVKLMLHSPSQSPNICIGKVALRSDSGKCENSSKNMDDIPKTSKRKPHTPNSLNADKKLDACSSIKVVDVKSLATSQGASKKSVQRKKKKSNSLITTSLKSPKLFDKKSAVFPQTSMLRQKNRKTVKRSNSVHSDLSQFGDKHIYSSQIDEINHTKTERKRRATSLEPNFLSNADTTKNKVRVKTPSKRSISSPIDEIKNTKAKRRKRRSTSLEPKILNNANTPKTKVRVKTPSKRRSIESPLKKNLPKYEIGNKIVDIMDDSNLDAFDSEESPIINTNQDLIPHENSHVHQDVNSTPMYNSNQNHNPCTSVIPFTQSIPINECCWKVYNTLVRNQVVGITYTTPINMPAINQRLITSENSLISPQMFQMQNLLSNVPFPPYTPQTMSPMVAPQNVSSVITPQNLGSMHGLQNISVPVASPLLQSPSFPSNNLVNSSFLSGSKMHRPVSTSKVTDSPAPMRVFQTPNSGHFINMTNPNTAVPLNTSTIMLLQKEKQRCFTSQNVSSPLTNYPQNLESASVDHESRNVQSGLVNWPQQKLRPTFSILDWKSIKQRGTEIDVAAVHEIARQYFNEKCHNYTVREFCSDPVVVEKLSTQQEEYMTNVEMPSRIEYNFHSSFLDEPFIQVLKDYVHFFLNRVYPKIRGKNGDELRTLFFSEVYSKFPLSICLLFSKMLPVNIQNLNISDLTTALTLIGILVIFCEYRKSLPISDNSETSSVSQKS